MRVLNDTIESRRITNISCNDGASLKYKKKGPFYGFTVLIHYLFFELYFFSRFLFNYIKRTEKNTILLPFITLFRRTFRLIDL